jgi:hypothetical protein
VRSGLGVTNRDNDDNRQQQAGKLGGRCNVSECKRCCGARAVRRTSDETESAAIPHQPSIRERVKNNIHGKQKRGYSGAEFYKAVRDMLSLM